MMGCERPGKTRHTCGSIEMRRCPHAVMKRGSRVAEALKTYSLRKGLIAPSTPAWLVDAWLELESLQGIADRAAIEKATPKKKEVVDGQRVL